MKFLKQSIIVAAAVVGSAITSPVFAQGGAAGKGAALAAKGVGEFVYFVARLAEREGLVVLDDAARQAARLGVDEARTVVLYSSAHSALRTLFPDAARATPAQIRNTLTKSFEQLAKDPVIAARFLEGTGRELKADELAALALKEVSELTAREQGELTSALALAAEKAKGGSVFAACSGCVDSELKKIGLFVVARVLKPIEANFYRSLPTEYRAIEGRIQSNVSKLASKGIKIRVNAAGIKKLNLTEQQGLIMALERGLNGDADQKAFFKALAAFSKEGNEADLLATRLWTLLTPLPDSDKFVSVDALSQITKQLEDATKAKTTVRDRNKLLSEWFDDVAAKRGMAAERAEMKAKNCFGIES
jgi:hypothetical protein